MLSLNNTRTAPRRLGSGGAPTNKNGVSHFKFASHVFGYTPDSVQRYDNISCGPVIKRFDRQTICLERQYVTQTWRNHVHSYYEDVASDGTVLDHRFIGCSPHVKEEFFQRMDDLNHSCCWVRTLVSEILDEVQPQAAPTEGDSFESRIKWSFFSLFSGSLKSDSKEIQSEIKKSLDAIKESGYTPISIFRFCVRNWRFAMQLPAFAHLGNLLGIAIVLGFAPPHWGEMHINAIRLFRTTNLERWSNGVDIVDGIVNALNYFVEACYASWQMGDLTPFMYEKTTSRQLDESYEELADLMHKMETGTFFSSGGKWSDVYAKAGHAKTLYEAAILIAPPQTLQRRVLVDRFAQIRSWLFQLSMEQKSSTTREQPFGGIFYGSPGCGKTELQSGLMHIIAAVHEIPFAEEQVADIIPGDAFDSRVTNSTMFIRVNDVANRPLKYDPSLGVAKFLQMCDNVPYTAVKAAVGDKGTVTPTVVGVIGSTNNESMDIDKLSVNGDSLRRRIHRIDVCVKPHYANCMGGRDDDKFELRPEYRTVNGMKLDAFQLITINRAIHGGFAPMEIEDPRTGNMRTLANLEIDEYYYFIELVVRKFHARQVEYVGRSKEFTLRPCTGCGFITCTCDGEPAYPVRTTPAKAEAIAKEAYPLARNNIFDIVEDDMYSVAQFIPHENQGLAETCASALAPFATRALLNRAGDIPMLAGMVNWGFQQCCGAANLGMKHSGVISQSVFEVLFRHVDAADCTQWWYWLPNDVWQWEVVRKLAPVLQDVEIRNRIRRYRTVSRGCMLGAGLLCFRRNYWSSLALFGVGTVSSTYLLLLRYTAYTALSAKRRACEQIAEVRRQAYGPVITQMIKATAVLTGGGLACYGIWAICREMFGDGSAEIESTTVETKPEVEAPPVEKKPQKPKGSKKKASVQPLCIKGDVRNISEVEQQNFMSLDEEDIIRRNETKNIWESNIMNAKLSYKNPNQTYEQLVNLVKNNTSALFIQSADKTYVYQCNVFWLTSELCVLPKHMAPTCIQRWRFQDDIRERSGGWSVVSPASVVKIKNADFAFVWAPYKSKKDLIKYLNPHPEKLDASFIYKDPTTYETIPGTSSLKGTVLEGQPSDPLRIGWEWPFPTFRGLCGGVYVTRGTHPCIAGFHFGGSRWVKSGDDRLTLGISFVPSQEDSMKVLKHFQAKKHVLVTAAEPDSWNPIINGVPMVDHVGSVSEGGVGDQVEWLTQQQDGGFVLDTTLYQKVKSSATGIAPTPEPAIEKQAVDVGTRRLKAFYKSRVVPTIIADEVQELCPELSFGPPRFGRSMWSKGALPAFNISPGLPPEHLEWAAEDFLKPFERLSPYLMRDLRPLTWEETINGIDGLRFIDSMNFSTSAGLGFPGGKKAWAIGYCTDDGQLRRDFMDEVKQRVDEAEQCLRTGTRVPFIYNATPKDEPTPVEKEKVRLFMVGELACVLLVRKYFTPVCRVIQMTTGISECAVGINCCSEDWENVMRHLEKFGEYFDGDHAKYDTRKHPSTSSASYRIMIEIAAKGHYTGDDLFLMGMLASELIRPLVNYNGDIFVLDGSTPSGIPVTVIVNGLDNSIYNRCAYKAIYPNSKVGDFRKYVAHINYGDDFINGVSAWRRRFNFINVQKYLRTYDLEITPGVKDAKPRNFIPWSDLVFLQRKDTKLPELTHRVGALAEKSIFKSLLSVLKSTELSPECAAVTNVDGALREWTFHGREVYEKRHKQMMEILDKKGLVHQSRMRDVSYEESLQKMTED